MGIEFQSSVIEIPFIGVNQAEKLKNLGITTVKDLVYHFPVRYSDTSEIISLSQLKLEGEGTVQVFIEDIKTSYTRSRKTITKAKVSDDSGAVNILWFNQRFIAQAIKPGNIFLMKLKLPKKPGAREFYCESYEKLSETREQLHLGRITAFYDLTEGVSAKWLRARITWCLKNLQWPPTNSKLEAIASSENFMSYREAIRQIHKPDSLELLAKARERIGFEEMLELAINLEMQARDLSSRTAIEVNVEPGNHENFIKALPFALTTDQESSVNELLQDLKATAPMNRLLNGDVGSGKTVVAAAAAFHTILSGQNVVIMAPTTILARQHFVSFQKLLEPFKINVELIISANRAKKDQTGGQEDAMNSSIPKLYIGTHALLYSDKLPQKIGLVVVDEQHRFGVSQREQLVYKEQNREITPHFLTMSATPIPRTLVNILYGGMQLSLIKSMPKNRLPIKSYFITESKREECMNWIHSQIKTEQAQVYIVFPLVEESEKSDLKAATAEFERLGKVKFKGIPMGLLHGRMKESEKDEILMKFKKQELKVLISTTVIEVGIDVPEATVMVIEDAERFGLAQLHQLRGRVGRGERQSYCFVIGGKTIDTNPSGIARLEYFAKHSSGFDIAEYDLMTRGPGEVYGKRQSGIPMFKVASITDFELYKKCREAANEILG